MAEPPKCPTSHCPDKRKAILPAGPPSTRQGPQDHALQMPDVRAGDHSADGLSVQADPVPGHVCPAGASPRSPQPAHWL
jgi:hypothetical protein